MSSPPLHGYRRASSCCSISIAPGASGSPTTPVEAHEAIVHGAVKRIRPKMMKVATILLSLLPLLGTYGTGADVMKRIAARWWARVHLGAARADGLSGAVLA